MATEKACGDAAWYVSIARLKCRLEAGHLGSHESERDGSRWFWNEHAVGIMRHFHPTTNRPIAKRELLEVGADGD